MATFHYFPLLICFTAVSNQPMAGDVLKPCNLQSGPVPVTNPCNLLPVLHQTECGDWQVLSWVCSLALSKWSEGALRSGWSSENRTAFLHTYTVLKASGFHLWGEIWHFIDGKGVNHCKPGNFVGSEPFPGMAGNCYFTVAVDWKISMKIEASWEGEMNWAPSPSLHRDACRAIFK